MASFTQAQGDAYVNVSTIVGAELYSISRDGTQVTFRYRAYMYQDTATWSTNAWSLWIEGTEYTVKEAHTQSSKDVKYYTPYRTRTVTLGVSTTSTSISVGVNGNSWNPTSPAGYVSLTLSGIPIASAPTLTALVQTSLSDKSVGLSFTVPSVNNASLTDYKIQISETNFGTAYATINAYSGTVSTLKPNKKYYARAYASNAAGTTYSNILAFTTSFINPTSPGKPVLTFDKPEIIPLAKPTAEWSAASGGSNPVEGYRLRIFKNNVEVDMIDTGSQATTYTFKTLESYGFIPGDKLKIGIYSYSVDWAGNKFFNGSEVSTSQVFSNEYSVVSDKYIYVSQNGGAFTKYKMYISVNGGSFIEVKKEKLKIIK